MDMALIVVENMVADYATFRVHFDQNAQRRTAVGITNPRIFRNADDGNDVLVIADVADPTKARQTLAEPAYRKAMQDAGMIGTPKIFIVE
jgi:hypothetical protein